MIEALLTLLFFAVVSFGFMAVFLGRSAGALQTACQRADFGNFAGISENSPPERLRRISNS